MQIEAALAGGLIAIEWQLGSVVATIVGAILVMVSALSGVLISLHHRKVEIRKFTHIINCEEVLGLHRSDLLPNVALPEPVAFIDAFRPRVRNTSAFILRMHISIFLFASIFLVARVYSILGR